jgi:BirA family biotin operon repressor/biotin-[acetyl-CoA-carboxylase] ligase
MHPFQPLVDTPLETEIIGTTIHLFDEIDSTNTWALEHGTEGQAVIADRQTSGRGRLGRTWFSLPGVGIWCTSVLEENDPGLTIAAALAVHDSVASKCAPKIKWPNDILVDGKKICGILVERKNGITAIGIGINVHQKKEDFPEDLQEKAGSLDQITQLRWDRVELTRELLTRLDQNAMLIRQGQLSTLHDRWAEACQLTGKTIRINDTLEGIVNQIDTDGAIVLGTPTGVERIYSGDITILNGE